MNEIWCVPPCLPACKLLSRKINILYRDVTPRIWAESLAVSDSVSKRDQSFNTPHILFVFSLKYKKSKEEKGISKNCALQEKAISEKITFIRYYNANGHVGNI